VLVNAYTILLGNADTRGQVGKYRNYCEDTVNLYQKETYFEILKHIHGVHNQDDGKKVVPTNLP
jgi:hypothetical protein